MRSFSSEYLLLSEKERPLAWLPASILRSILDSLHKSPSCKEGVEKACFSLFTRLTNTRLGERGCCLRSNVDQVDQGIVTGIRTPSAIALMFLIFQVKLPHPIAATYSFRWFSTGISNPSRFPNALTTLQTHQEPHSISWPSI